MCFCYGCKLFLLVYVLELFIVACELCLVLIDLPLAFWFYGVICCLFVVGVLC